MQIKLDVRVKDINVKSLETGDKSAWIKFETLYPEDVEKLAMLLGVTFAEVTVDVKGSNKISG